MTSQPFLVWSLFAALACASACAAVTPARFADAPIVTEVDDARPIRTPAKRLATPFTYAHAIGRRTVVDGLEPRRAPRASDVNALDDVPPSSWFTGPLDGAVGASDPGALTGPPVPPLRVMPRHPESGRSGLVVIDARGLRYELGRDPKDRPRMRTTAAVVATSLVRAVGYRAPEVVVIDLREQDLAMQVVDGLPPAREAVRAFLDDGPPASQGVYRASATRWPPGVDLGPTQPHDVREDDPNDRVPHEDRRTLRALRVVRAWLSFPGFGVDSLRDVYVGPAGGGHVEHFVVGLEGALGADRARGDVDEPRSSDAAPDPTRGREPVGLLVTFGLGGAQPRRDPRFPALGAFEPKLTDDDYESEVVFAPTNRMLPGDAYWVAKRIARVSAREIEAAADLARTDDATRARLVSVITARRDAAIARAFAGVTPCEVASVKGGVLTLRDLGFTRAAPATFEVETVDDLGAQLEPPHAISPTGAVFNLSFPPAPYLVIRLRAVRGSFRAPRAVEVHVRVSASGSRVVGVEH